MRWWRSSARSKRLELTADPGPGGAVTIHAVVDGLTEKYVFTPI